MYYYYFNSIYFNIINSNNVKMFGSLAQYNYIFNSEGSEEYIRFIMFFFILSMIIFQCRKRRWMILT